MPAFTPHPHTTFFTSSRVYWTDIFRSEEHGHQLAGQPVAPSQAALHPGHSLCAIARPRPPFTPLGQQDLASW